MSLAAALPARRSRRRRCRPRVTRARSASRSANGPTPQNRSATVLRLAGMRRAPAARASLRPPRSPAGRRRAAARRARGPCARVGAARCAIISPWRVSRASRCAVGKPRQRAVRVGVQRARAAHVDIEPAVGRGHLDVERLARGLQRLGDRPGGRDRAVERGREHRAAIDRRRSDARAAPRKPTSSMSRRAAARMKDGAAAALAMRIDQRIDRRVDARLARALRPQARASRRGSARRPNAGSRSRRRCRNAGRTAAMRSATCRRRPAADGGDRDGPATARPRRSRPAMCRAHRAARRRIGDAVAAMADARDDEPLRQASFTVSTAISLPSASNTLATMPLASRPARAYIAAGVS